MCFQNATFTATIGTKKPPKQQQQKKHQQKTPPPQKTKTLTHQTNPNPTAYEFKNQQEEISNQEGDHPS